MNKLLHKKLERKTQLSSPSWTPNIVNRFAKFVIIKEKMAIFWGRYTPIFLDIGLTI